KPGDELAGDGPRRTQQALASNDFADHEVAKKLAKVVDDLVWSEQSAEGLLVTSLVGRFEGAQLVVRQHLVSVRVEARAQQLEYGFVHARRPWSKPQLGFGEELAQHALDR